MGMTRGRAMAVTAGAGVLLAAGAMFGAGTAAGSAPPAPRLAPDALVANCGDTVAGMPGQQVGVRLGPILGTVPIGAVPAEGAPPSVLSPVTDLLCRVTAVAITPLPPEIRGPVEQAGEAAGGILPQGSQPAPEQPGPGQPAPGSPPAQQNPPPQGAPGPAPGAGPGGPVAGSMPPGFDFSLPSSGLGGFDFGEVPLYDYSQLFAASPGLFGSAPAPGVLSGTDLFGYSPEFAPLGEDEAAGPADDVAAAGRASALPAEGTDGVALPVLLAVLMLSGVSAALIRSWVLKPAT